MKKIFLLFFVFSAWLSLFNSPAFAHPGNTAADGCHYCKTNCASWGEVYGERHCHGGGSTYTPTYYTPTYYTPSIPTCPLHSYYDSLSGNCKCASGYYASGSACKSYDDLCEDTHGWQSRYNSISDTCECNYGYRFDSESQCVSNDTYCSDLFGFGSNWSILKDACVCKSGYEFDGTKCDYQISDTYYSPASNIDYNYYFPLSTVTCPKNAKLGTDQKCYCNDGYTVNKSKDGCIAMDTWCDEEYGSNIFYDSADKICTCEDGYLFSDKKNQCITPDKSCQEISGLHSHAADKQNTDGSYDCLCNTGYVFDTQKDKCIKQKINKTSSKEIDESDSNSTDTKEKPVFTDLGDTHKNKNAILYLKEKGIIGGYDDGTFKPENDINRAELLKILIEGKGIHPTVDEYNHCFKDVREEWFAPYVCYASKQGWVSGYKNGQFKPDKNVSKSEAIKMLLNSNGVEIPESIDIQPFNDIETSWWEAPYISKAKELGILEETGDVFSGNNGMKRGGISENLYRLLTNNNDAKEDNSEVFTEIKDIKTGSELDATGVVVISKKEFGSDTAVIFVSAVIEDAKSGQKVSAKLIHIDSKEEVGPATNDTETNGDISSNFEFTKPTNGWPTGDYRIDIDISGDIKKSVSFKVINP